VKKLVSAGYDTIPKVGAMSVDDFLKIDGFKTKTATKIHDSIQEKIAGATLEKLMGVSGIFGRGLGERKATALLKQYPNVVTEKGTVQDIAEKIRQVDGFAAKSALQFAERIPAFVTLMQDLGLSDKLQAGSPSQQYDEGHALFGKDIVLTGLTDKDLKKQIKDVGANLKTGVSGNTFVVVVKSMNDLTGKAEKAIALNIPRMEKDEFIATYL
jgi:NAD-dependent DNA ligase